eukprot:Pompholyxophrys_punicea_v1_NODE_28_length_5163_cov_5.731206.p14 type:complete len:105 gc:universal NODE_28_length_5163_cov_5.731206:4197-4511(+)
MQVAYPANVALYMACEHSTIVKPKKKEEHDNTAFVLTSHLCSEVLHDVIPPCIKCLGDLLLPDSIPFFIEVRYRHSWKAILLHGGRHVPCHHHCLFSWELVLRE